MKWRSGFLSNKFGCIKKISLTFWLSLVLFSSPCEHNSLAKMTSSISMPTTPEKKRTNKIIDYDKVWKSICFKGFTWSCQQFISLQGFQCIRKRERETSPSSQQKLLFKCFLFIFIRVKKQKWRKTENSFLFPGFLLLNFVLLFYFFKKERQMKEKAKRGVPWRRLEHSKPFHLLLHRQHHHHLSLSLNSKMLTQCQQEGFLLPFTIFVLYKHTYRYITKIHINIYR